MMHPTQQLAQQAEFFNSFYSMHLLVARIMKADPQTGISLVIMLAIAQLCDMDKLGIEHPAVIIHSPDCDGSCGL